MGYYYYEHDDKVWFADEVMFLTSIPTTIAFAAGDRGNGTQLKKPCNNGNCIASGLISRRCTASSFGRP